MVEPNPQPPESGDSVDPEGVELPADIRASNQQIGHLITSAQCTLAEQFQVAERLDAKARNQVTLTAAYFAAVLAAALGVCARDSTSQLWVIAICAVGAIAVVFLLRAVLDTGKALAVSTEHFVKIPTLQSYSGFAYDGHPLVGKNIADLTLKVAAKRKQANAERGGKVETAAGSCQSSLWATSGLLLLLFLAVAVTS